MKNNLHPGFVFFVRQDDGPFIKLDKDVSGIHALAKYMISKFLTDLGYEYTKEGKHKLFIDIINNGINSPDMDPIVAIESLTEVILNVFEIRKTNTVQHLNNRSMKHIRYGIQKEFKNALIYADVLSNPLG